MKANPLRQQIGIAARACEDKHAQDLAIIQMDKSSSAFTDYFLICSGANSRQVQAIAESVQMQLKQHGILANNVEGYKQAEWVLLDYVDFVVHVFVESARKFYDLERLWKSAIRLSPADLQKKEIEKKTQPRTDPDPLSPGAKTQTKAAPLRGAAAQPRAMAKRLGATRKKNPVASALARGPARTGKKSRGASDRAGAAQSAGPARTRNPAKSRNPLSKMSVAAKHSKKTR